MYYVYILVSRKDHRTYVGYSNNIERRLDEHNDGRSPATKHRRPFDFLFSEEFATEQEAKKREKYWKSGAGRRKLKQYFANFNVKKRPPVKNQEWSNNKQLKQVLAARKKSDKALA